MWRVMVEMYGTAFLSAYGETPSPLWTAVIEKLSDERCRKGLARLAKEAREYPANLTQFVAACNHSEPVRFLGTPTTASELAALEPSPEQRATREAVDSWLAKMRNRLR